MKLFNKKQVITLAFNTEDDNNQLSKNSQFALIEKLSRAFGGATLRENVGGYMMGDGTAAIEYSYTIELVGVKKAAALATAKNIARENGQESFILNDKLVYTKQEAYKMLVLEVLLGLGHLILLMLPAAVVMLLIVSYLLKFHKRAFVKWFNDFFWLND